MATYNIKQARSVWSNRAKKIKQAGIKTTNQASRFMINTAKSIAPHKTQETIHSIKRRTIPLGFRVESFVQGKFKQNLWANRQAPYDKPHYKKYNRFYKVPQTVVYGQPAITHSGKRVIFTGMPRFWDISAGMTAKVFKNLSVKIIRNAIR